MKKYILLTVERYQTLKRQSASANQTIAHATTAQPLASTTIPPGQLTTTDLPENQPEPDSHHKQALKAKDKYNKAVSLSVQSFPDNSLSDQELQRNLADPSDDAIETSKPKKQKRDQPQKQTHKNINKQWSAKEHHQNELSAAATAGRHRQFWLKP